jgi:hypothetical protein
MQKIHRQNSTSFHNKSSDETRNRGNVLQRKKVIYDKPIANIILNEEKLKTFLKSQESDKGPHSLYYSTVLEFLAKSVRQEEEIKGIQIGK